MRALLTTVFAGLLAFLAIYAGPYIYENPGYVLVAYGKDYFEMTLVALLLILFGSWLVLKVLFFILARTLRIGSQTRFYFFNKSQKKARIALRQGMTAYLLGDWQRAEKQLSSAGDLSDLPEIKHLFAAAAADAAGDDDKVAMHLNALDDDSSDTTLFKARLWLNRQQWQEALELLEPLVSRKPKDDTAFILYLKALEGAEHWQTLFALLAKVDKRQLMNDNELAHFAGTVISMALADTCRSESYEAAEKQFEQLPGKIKKASYAVAAQVALMVDNGQGEKAEELLVKVLKKSGVEDYLSVFRQVRFDNGFALNKYLQQALKGNEEDLSLLRALGHLAIGRKDWGLAAKALSKTIGPGSDNADLKALALAYGELGDSHQALGVYRRLQS